MHLRSANRASNHFQTLSAQPESLRLSGVHSAIASFVVLAESQKAQEGQSGQQSTGKGTAAHPPRATDAFYAKLLPALEVSLHPQPMTPFLIHTLSPGAGKYLHIPEELQLNAHPDPGVVLHAKARVKVGNEPHVGLACSQTQHAACVLDNQSD